jgi:hypothetical protein
VGCVNIKKKHTNQASRSASNPRYQQHAATTNRAENLDHNFAMYFEFAELPDLGDVKIFIMSLRSVVVSKVGLRKIIGLGS